MLSYDSLELNWVTLNLFDHFSSKVVIHIFIKVGRIIILLQNGLEVKPVHAIWDKALSDELGQLIQALLERGIWIAGVFPHFLVVPDLCVDPEEGLLDPPQRKSAGEEEKAVVIS